MRDIYKTAKKAQTTPVRGRVKAMMAQPRAVAQARKIARQTTGFKKGGLHKLNGSSLLKYDQIVAEEQEKAKKKAKKKLNGKQEGGTVKPMSHNSELTKWFLEQHGGTQKGKPHSTRKGRIAAGERVLRRGVEEFERKRKKRRMGPGAPSRPRPKAGPPAGRPKAPGGIQGLPRPKAGPPAGRPKTPREYQDPLNPFKKKKKKKKEEPGMDVKKGGVVQKVFLGKLMEKIGLNKKQVSATSQDPLDATGQDYKRMRPEPTHQQMVDVFKDKFAGKKKGGVMDIEKLMQEKKPHSTKAGRKAAVGRHRIRWQKWFDSFKEPTAMEKGKAKAKEHKEKLKKLGRKAVGYVKGWTEKKKGGKVKRGCANGGTVVMPTVGNDVRVRAYKQGALIHPRPRPTTVLHGRPRGVGIAKRGW